MKIHATPGEVFSRIPGPASARWPEGERFAVALEHGTMTVEYYAPVGHDPQTPHEQDELYFIHTGTGVLTVDGTPHAFTPGDCLFVPARVEHRFTEFSEGFAAWVVFWGPKGGERP